MVAGGSPLRAASSRRKSRLAKPLGRRRNITKALHSTSTRSDEVSGEGTHESGGSDGLAAMLTKEVHHPAGIRQAGDIGIQVHAVDALHLQSDVIFQKGSEALWYAHDGSFADRGPHGPTN